MSMAAMKKFWYAYGKMKAAPNNEIIKDRVVNRLGFKIDQSTTITLSNIPIGAVMKDDHHSSSLFLVFHKR
jgi:hypothetical protein